MSNFDSEIKGFLAHGARPGQASLLSVQPLFCSLYCFGRDALDTQLFAPDRGTNSKDFLSEIEEIARLKFSMENFPSVDSIAERQLYSALRPVLFRVEVQLVLSFEFAGLRER